MRFSLYLYPKIAAAKPLPDLELTQALTELELLGPPLDKSCYQAGDKLMDYINFLGCSPAHSVGEVEPTLQIHQFDQITGLGGESIETIRYPGCKHPIANVAQLLSNFATKPRWQCPECSNQGHIDQINWRKTAGFSSLFIEITDIFPKEAIPNDALLSQLEKTTSTEWKWFYSKSSESHL